MNKKIIPPIIVSILMILYFFLYFGLLFYVIPGIWKYFFGIFPFIYSIFMIIVLVERVKEIKKGEDDDISKY